MLFRLVLLFTITPIVDLVLLFKIADLTNWKVPLAIMLLTGVAGAALAKHQGLAVLRELREQVERGIVPAGPLLDGAFVLVGGAFLITPGVITDALGIAFLFPWTRKFFKRLLKKWIKARIHHTSFRP